MQDWISKLERAKALRDSGALTEQEFETEKSKLLPRASPIKIEEESHLDDEFKRDGSRLYRARFKIAVAAAAALIVAATAYVARRDQIPSPKTATLQTALPIDTVDSSSSIPDSVVATKAAEPEISKNIRKEEITEDCSNGLSLNIPEEHSKSGVLVVNYPLADTDAMGQIVVEAKSVVCLQPEILSKFARESGRHKGDTIDLLLSLDPNGKSDRPRAQLDYMVLFCDELSKTDPPPSDLMLGEVRWTVGKTESESIKWSNNFRAEQEAGCAKG